MSFKRFILPVSLVFTAFFISLSSVAEPVGQSASHASITDEKIVVANRASGTLSIISSASDRVITTVDLPPGDAAPEPMYVVYSRITRRIAVGDRANNRIVVFNADDFSLAASIPGGKGIFHMWADPLGRELWVNNDIDNTISVIDMRRLELTNTIALPEDLVEMGGKPHDIVLDFRHAYVTVVGLPADDYLLKYDRRRFNEVAREPVGKDSHVSLSIYSSKLFVPSQNSDTVFVFNRKSFRLIDEIAVPGAHGAGMTQIGNVLYTTNLPNGGEDGLIAIDTRANKILGEPADTPFAVPHNAAATRFGRKVYVTHSGPNSNKVSVFRTSRRNPTPALVTSVDVGFNPFGLTVIP